MNATSSRAERRFRSGTTGFIDLLELKVHFNSDTRPVCRFVSRPALGGIVFGSGSHREHLQYSPFVRLYRDVLIKVDQLLGLFDCGDQAERAGPSCGEGGVRSTVARD